MSSIRDCFVTGKWEDDKDAAKLLEEDGMCQTSKNDYCIQDFKEKYDFVVTYVECFALVIYLQIFFKVSHKYYTVTNIIKHC